MSRRKIFVVGRFIAQLVVVSCCVALATGCGGGSATATSVPDSLSGNWQMSLQKSNSTLKPRIQSGFLVQNQGAVTGGVMLIDYPCTGLGTLTGSVDGSNVAFTVSLPGLDVTLTGTVGSAPGSMTGSYTILSTGCLATSGDKQETGTWTANLVAALNGSLEGTLTSKHLGTAIAVTGQVTQGQNSGLSSASLSGNLSATGYCFSTATASGSISGTSAVMNLLNAAGVQIGQIVATTSLDGKTVTGTYTILPMGPSAAYPCNIGDSGTVAWTL